MYVVTPAQEGQNANIGTLFWVTCHPNYGNQKTVYLENRGSLHHMQMRLALLHAREKSSSGLVTLTLTLTLNPNPKS
jgi:hypothetical protein